METLLWKSCCFYGHLTAWTLRVLPVFKNGKIALLMLHLGSRWIAGLCSGYEGVKEKFCACITPLCWRYHLIVIMIPYGLKIFFTSVFRLWRLGKEKKSLLMKLSFRGVILSAGMFLFFSCVLALWHWEHSIGSCFFCKGLLTLNSISTSCFPEPQLATDTLSLVWMSWFRISAEFQDLI